LMVTGVQTCALPIWAFAGIEKNKIAARTNAAEKLMDWVLYFVSGCTDYLTKILICAFSKLCETKSSIAFLARF
jgi:hypothetical protein